MNFHSWLAAPVQASCSTAVPLAVELPAAVAHRPEAWLTTSNHDEVTPEGAKFMEWMFHPPLSWSTTSAWVPAGRGAVAVTLGHVFPPPGARTLTLPDRVGAARPALCRPSRSPLRDALP